MCKCVSRLSSTLLTVLIHFQAAGDAPILNQTKFKVSASHSFAVVAEFLRKQLRYKQKDSLFLFCNASFSPNPDELVNDLYECFKVNDELVINYCSTPAWG